LRGELREVREDRDDDRRRQEPPRHDRAGTFGGEEVGEPGVRPPGEQADADQEEGDRVGERHAEQRCAAVREQHGEAVAHDREQRDGEEHDRGGSTDRFGPVGAHGGEHDPRRHQLERKRGGDRHQHGQIAAVPCEAEESEVEARADAERVPGEHQYGDRRDHRGADARPAHRRRRTALRGMQRGNGHQEGEHRRELRGGEIGAERPEQVRVDEPADGDSEHYGDDEGVREDRHDGERAAGRLAPTAITPRRAARSEGSALARNVSHAGGDPDQLKHDPYQTMRARALHPASP
jgi:hypothetical protein